MAVNLPNSPVDGEIFNLGSVQLVYSSAKDTWTASLLGTSGASTTEMLQGVLTSKYATPDSAAALWEKGADIASAATISLAEGGVFDVTGTTTITDIDFAEDKTGRGAWLIFEGILTLTHGANLILPSGANIVTAAGDSAYFVSEGADVVRCVVYQRANGTPLVASAGTKSLIVAVSDETTVITAGTAKITFRAPTAMNLTDIKASLTTAGTTNSVVDVNVTGVGTIMTTNKITIEATEKSSKDATTQPALTTTSIAADAEITIDIDTAGTNAVGLKVTFVYT